MSNRQENNLEIIKLLTTIIETCPETRFCQLLYGLDLLSKEPSNSFYEESSTTLKKLQETSDRFLK